MGKRAEVLGMSGGHAAGGARRRPAAGKLIESVVLVIGEPESQDLAVFETAVRPEYEVLDERFRARHYDVTFEDGALGERQPHVVVRTNVSSEVLGDPHCRILVRPSQITAVTRVKPEVNGSGNQGGVPVTRGW